MTVFRSPDNKANFSVATPPLDSNVTIEEFMQTFLAGTPWTVKETVPLTLAGNDAMVATWSASNEAGQALEGATFFTKAGSRGYALTGTTAADVGNIYDAQLNNFLSSFQLGAQAAPTTPAAAASPQAGFTRLEQPAANFRIDHPSDWTVDTSQENLVALQAPDNQANFSVASLNVGDAVSLDEFATTFLAGTPFNITDKLPTDIGGQPAQIAVFSATDEAGAPIEGAVFITKKGPWA